MKDKNTLFSVVLLKESTIKEQINRDDAKFFEESIVLINTEEEFFEKNSQESLLAYFNKKNTPR